MALSQLQTQQLVQAWSDGMSHCDSPRVSEVAQTSGLTVAQVKNWIGNYRRKISGPPPTRKKIRQPSGYNLFCREMASKTDQPLEKCSKEIGQAWTSLPERNKQQYREKARQETMSPPNLKEKIRKAIKQLDSCTLNSLGVHGFGAIVVPGSSEFQLKGTTRGISYISKEKQIATEFVLSLQKPEAPDQDGKLESKKERETLRRLVQDLFNQKYKEAHGPEAKLSYKKGAEVEGLPNRLKLHKPSAYGLPSLKAILSASGVIKFKKIDGKSDEDSNKKAVAVPSTVAVSSTVAIPSTFAVPSTVAVGTKMVLKKKKIEIRKS